MGRLDGRVAILTGAGRGIGAATAAKLAAEGAAVAVTDMDIGPAEETAEVIRSAGGKAPACASQNRHPSVKTSHLGNRAYHPRLGVRPPTASLRSLLVWCRTMKLDAYDE